MDNIPLLKIHSLTSQKAQSTDWEAYRKKLKDRGLSIAENSLYYPEKQLCQKPCPPIIFIVGFDDDGFIEEPEVTEILESLKIDG